MTAALKRVDRAERFAFPYFKFLKKALSIGTHKNTIQDKTKSQFFDHPV